MSLDDLDVDPRTATAADTIGDGVRSANPYGDAAPFSRLAAAWLPHRCEDHDDEPAWLLLLATPTGPEDGAPLAAPYFVAVLPGDRPADGIAGPGFADLVAVEELPTYDGALAAFAARLTGEAVEALVGR